MIEVDGYAYHSTRQAPSTRDRRKDVDLETRRLPRSPASPHDQILHDPEDTLRADRAGCVGGSQ